MTSAPSRASSGARAARAAPAGRGAGLGGQTIAFFEVDGYSPADLAGYDARFGLPAGPDRPCRSARSAGWPNAPPRASWPPTPPRPCTALDCLAPFALPPHPPHVCTIVTSPQQANAPDAVPDYVVPGASLGYTPGYGEAFQVMPCSADGNPVRFEVMIICAVRDGYAICAYAVGPQVSLGRLVTHPTEARLALALWADPDLNGVRWKGPGLP
jgi:hypothetical protein